MDNCWNLFYLFILSLTSGSIWRTLNQLRSKLQDPGRVDISTWFLHVGTKSIAFYLEIFTTRPLLEIASSRQLAAACCQGLVKQYILLTTVGEYCQQGPHLVETADLLSYWPFILCLYELKGCLCLERKKGVVFFSPSQFGGSFAKNVQAPGEAEEDVIGWMCVRGHLVTSMPGEGGWAQLAL